MDSVLAEITEPLIRFCKEEYGIVTKLEDILSYGLHEVWGVTPARVMEMIYEFYRSAYFDEIQPVNGSVEGIKYLVTKYDLVVITSRPFWIEEKSIAWIKTYFGDVFGKIVHTNQYSSETGQKKKSTVCIEEGAGWMIEDSLEYATECAVNGIRSILLTMPWNKNGQLHPNITRVAHWRDIQKLL